MSLITRITILFYFIHDNFTIVNQRMHDINPNALVMRFDSTLVDSLGILKAVFENASLTEWDNKYSQKSYSPPSPSPIPATENVPLKLSHSNSESSDSREFASDLVYLGIY